MKKDNLGMHYRKRDNTIEVTTPKKKEKLFFDGIAAAHTPYGIRIKPSEYANSFVVDQNGHKRYF
jgi:hypothetical protein